MRVSALFFMLTFLAIGFSGATSLQAAESSCKALANDACAGNAGCSWVKPYKTKKGKDIAGFCRKKGKHSSKPKAATTDAKS